MFDASAKCEGVTLNDVTYQEPKSQNYLFNLFRQYLMERGRNVFENRDGSKGQIMP